MTTASSHTTVSNSSDATFRDWGLHVSNLLTAAGFPKSTDTGQIDWTSATRPAVSTAAGYEIRYLNDSLHGSKPIYVKIEYGSNNPQSIPNIWITVASGTNGAGTVSGTTYFPRDTIIYGAAFGAISYPSFACATEGFVGLAAFRGYSSTFYSAFFAVLRTTDAAGAPSATGVITYRTSVGNLTRTVYMGSTLYTAANNYCLIPGSPLSTTEANIVKVFRHFNMQPEVVCSPQLISFYAPEIQNETVFTATPVGATVRTYLALSSSAGPDQSALGGAAGSNKLGMLWE